MMKLSCTAFLVALPMHVFAQQINTPLQDERLNPIACLLAIEPLPTTYRSHLQRDCIRVPLKICELRGTTKACLSETIDHLDDFYRAVQPTLPMTIDGSSFAASRYAAALVKIETVFGKTSCAGSSDLVCIYTERGSSMIDLFYRARQAGVDLSKVGP